MDASRQAFSVEDQMKSLPSMVPLVERVIWPLPGKIEDEAQIKLDPPRAFVIQGAEGTSIQVYSVPVIDEKIEVVGDQPVELLKQEEVEIKLEPLDLDQFQEDDECVLVKDEEKKCVIVEDEDEKKCVIDEDDQKCVIGEDKEKQSFSSQVIKTEDEEIKLEVTEKEQADNVSVKSEAKDDQDYEIIEDDQYCEIIEDDQDCEIIEDEEHLQEENSKVESSDSEYTDYETLEEEADDSVKPEDPSSDSSEAQKAARENQETHEEGICKPFKCLFCQKKFSQKSHLIVHQRTHIGTKSNPCVRYRISSSNQSKINFLLRSGHISRNPWPFKCLLCVRKFIRKSDLIQHQRTHIEIKRNLCLQSDLSPSNQSKTNNIIPSGHIFRDPFNCVYCNKSFSSKTFLNKHQIVHERTRSSSQKICERPGRSDQDYFKAVLLNHIKLYVNQLNQEEEIPEADSEFPSNDPGDQLRNDQLETSRVKTFNCFICSELFPQKSDLIGHLTNHAKIESEKYCLPCKKSFSTQAALRKHKINSHAAGKPGTTRVNKFSCSFCDKSFSLKTFLIKHQIVHERTTCSSQKICERPGRSDQDYFKAVLLNRIELYVNQLIQEEEIPKAESEFPSNDPGVPLRNGQLETSRVKTFNCFLCGELFPQKSDLIGHLINHTKHEFENYCLPCKKSFSTQATLRRHEINSHAAGKPETTRVNKFICFFCDERFIQKSVLVEHLKKHSKVDSVSYCLPCKKYFSSQAALRRHNRVWHAVEN